MLTARYTFSCPIPFIGGIFQTFELAVANYVEKFFASELAFANWPAKKLIPIKFLCIITDGRADCKKNFQR